MRRKADLEVLRQSKGRSMGGVLEEELRVPGGRIRVDLMAGELGYHRE